MKVALLSKEKVQLLQTARHDALVSAENRKLVTSIDALENQAGCFLLLRVVRTAFSEVCLTLFCSRQVSYTLPVSVSFIVSVSFAVSLSVFAFL